MVEGAEMALDDAAMKAEIEERIRNEGATSRKRQDEIAGEVRRQWDDLREKREERVSAELAKTTGQPDKAGAEKPGKFTPRGDGPRPAPAVNIGGHGLSSFEGKTDVQIRDMLSGNDASKAAQLKQIREAQKARDER
jgi:hypothetical protein